MTNIPSHLPKCPNHGCALEGCGFPLPRKGEGICPVSGAHFEFEVDIAESSTEVKKDKDGNIIKTVGWKLNGND